MSEHPAPDKSWQARIGEATDALGQSFVESISYDRRMYKQDIAGSVAHATMLEVAGLLTTRERDDIIQHLQAIESEIDAGTFAFDEGLEDIHMVIEKALTERTDAGKKLHTGRSRNDQVATDFILWMSDAAGEVVGRLQDLGRAFVSMAQRSGDLVMPSYTHLQRAQPIRAGAECLAWCTMFLGDADRVTLAGRRGVSPLGSGAIAGSSLPIAPSVTADMLGFASPPISSIERTASRDQALEFVFALALISMHLSRWAEQWITYSSTEFSFVKIADRYTTGSSMMPQKRNPDMLELIRGRCGPVYGHLVSLLTIMKGLPIGYNRDLQEDKRTVFAAFDVVQSCLAMAAAIVASASFVRENIEPTLDRGFLDATSLAEYLVGKGIPFRTAHQIVGTLVARSEREGKTALAELSVADFQKAARDAGTGNEQAASIGPDVYESLGAQNVVNRYRSTGAAGGAPYETLLAQYTATLGL